MDYAFGDAPQGWLSAPEPTPNASPPPQNSATATPHQTHTDAPEARPIAATTPPAPATMLGGPRENWPTTLPGFHAWWLTEPSLDAPELTGFAPENVTGQNITGTRPRVPPRGPANPPLMVIVPQPEEGDTDHLLSGPHGRLLSAILPMLGLSEAEVTIASALPRPMPLPDWPALAASGLGAVLLHHIALVAPQRVIAFGANVLPLLGHAPTQSTAPFPQIAHEGFSCALLPVGDLAMLLERPAAKARFWQRWLEFSPPDVPGR